MKKQSFIKVNLFLFIILFALFQFHAQSQSTSTSDSLRLLFKNSKSDTARVKLLLEWGMSMISYKPDSTLILWKKANSTAEVAIGKIAKGSEEYKIYKSNYATSLGLLGYYYHIYADYKTALEYYFKGVKEFEYVADKKEMGNLLNNVALIYKNLGDKNLAITYNEKSLVVRQEIRDSTGISTSLNNLAVIYQDKGDIVKAVDYFNQSLLICKRIKDLEGISTAYINLGHIAERQGDIPKALEYQTKSLKIAEEIKDQEGIASALNNIGIVHKLQGDYKKAIEYFTKGLNIRNSAGNKLGASFSLNNIGSVYKEMGDLEKSLKYFMQAFDLRSEIGDKLGIANSYNNIGTVYEKQGKNELAKNNYEKSLKLQQEVDDKQGIAYSYFNISGILLKENKYVEAIKYAVESMKLGRVLGFPELIRNVAERLNNLYKLTGNFKLALENYELFIKMRDSVNNIETQKATILQQSKFEFDKKKAIADKEYEFKINQQKKIAEAEKNQQKIIILSVSILFILLSIFSFFLFNRFKVTKRQKLIIEAKESETRNQKILIEEKHKEITDSINYAERIQRSFLATDFHLSENLSDYFILFKPKDVVSGDFYWSATLKNGLFAIATADSTGHGVPGAIMSLLNITSLEKAVENHIDPSEILNTTRKIIIDRLKKDGSMDGGKDGMDCSLCVYDFSMLKLFVAAAHNPVWIVRDEQVIEVKGDKMPVGKHDNQNTAFTSHEIDLKTGDVVYTLTDGFPDQFGGEKGKKFMSKNLRELLLKNASLPMETQRQLLENTFNSWRGELEQIDDVCLIGIKI